MPAGYDRKHPCDRQRLHTFHKETVPALTLLPVSTALVFLKMTTSVRRYSEGSPVMCSRHYIKAHHSGACSGPVARARAGQAPYLEAIFCGFATCIKNTQRLSFCRAMVVHTSKPSTWKQRQAELYEFKANVIYKESSRKARAIQENLVSKEKKKKHPEI